MLDFMYDNAVGHINNIREDLDKYSSQARFLLGKFIVLMIAIVSGMTYIILRIIPIEFTHDLIMDITIFLLIWSLLLYVFLFIDIIRDKKSKILDKCKAIGFIIVFILLIVVILVFNREEIKSIENIEDGITLSLLALFGIGFIVSTIGTVHTVYKVVTTENNSFPYFPPERFLENELYREGSIKAKIEIIKELQKEIIHNNDEKNKKRKLLIKVWKYLIVGVTTGIISSLLFLIILL